RCLVGSEMCIRDRDTYLSTIESLQKLRPDMLLYSHGYMEREPGWLMARASETARVYSGMILDAARKGRLVKDIMRLVGDDFHSRFGQRLTSADLEMAVAGYIFYFTSQGMLP
ncbi:MAG: hypothetical protein QUS33_00460, partial [Dehalococcoidia bacterium]|nr:hypothetical protein [Dehalococcoidia bacterium]